MAIIRNDRSARLEPVTIEQDEPEEEIDYSWHPNEDEYVSPLTAAQWAELLSDDAFAQSDEGKAVRCLREYGAPATFQQLSIRYRGTMGRYRRWLAGAAQAAGERFGVAAPQQDQFGMDEWWPLLYQIRNAGKPGAGIFEMSLRTEVEEAFLQIEEEERQAKRIENARQLKRIERLERSRQQERQNQIRSAESKDEAAVSDEPKSQVTVSTESEEVERACEPAGSEAPMAAAQDDSQVEEKTSTQKRSVRLDGDGAVSVPIVRAKPADSSRHEMPMVETGLMEVALPALPATRSFLHLMEDDAPTGGVRFVTAEKTGASKECDASAPIDYALRYAERLRYAFALMRSAKPSITLASIARELGDSSVEQLQKVVNGQCIPDFSYLDTLKKRLYVKLERLEMPDGLEGGVPAFATLHEVYGTDGVGDLLISDVPSKVAYVVDDSDDRRTGVIMCFSNERCALLTRKEVRGAARRANSPKLEAFIHMVDELDGFARGQQIQRTSRQVEAREWDELVSGRMWPGMLVD